MCSKLERAKRYLKTNYQSHCSENATIKTHNTVFALSYINEEPCVPVTDEVCVECLSVVEVLQKLLDIAAQSKNEDLRYDVNRSVGNVVAYIQHQIRD